MHSFYDYDYVENNILNSTTYITQQELDNKQDKLISGENIKTINHESLLGSGNINVATSGGTSSNYAVDISMKSYQKPNETSAISETDNVAEAIGKVEAKADVNAEVLNKINSDILPYIVYFDE